MNRAHVICTSMNLLREGCQIPVQSRHVSKKTSLWNKKAQTSVCGVVIALCIDTTPCSPMLSREQTALWLPGCFAAKGFKQRVAQRQMRQAKWMVVSEVGRKHLNHTLTHSLHSLTHFWFLAIWRGLTQFTKSAPNVMIDAWWCNDVKIGSMALTCKWTWRGLWDIILLKKLIISHHLIQVKQVQKKEKAPAGRLWQGFSGLAIVPTGVIPSQPVRSGKWECFRIGFGWLSGSRAPATCYLHYNHIHHPWLRGAWQQFLEPSLFNRLWHHWLGSFLPSCLILVSTCFKHFDCFMIFMLIFFKKFHVFFMDQRFWAYPYTGPGFIYCKTVHLGYSAIAKVRTIRGRGARQADQEDWWGKIIANTKQGYLCIHM